MEDFFDYALGIVLIALLSMIGLLVYFSSHAPLLAHFLASVVLAGFIGGAIIVVLWIIQRKRIENYYPLLQTFSRAYKDVKKAFKTLDRPMRRSLKPLLPKIKRLRKAIRNHIWKLYAIDKTLKTLHQHQHSILLPHQHYYEHIHAIETSKTQYLAEIQNALQYLHTLQAQLLAIHYTPPNSNIAHIIPETLDELLIEIETLREVE